ncbi:MAG: YihY/virulence factor BrkB family protein [Tetrasphaera sp.]|nr:YihY/virulence factor BrkB family protein [Tetrasphaera sp.]
MNVFVDTISIMWPVRRAWDRAHPALSFSLYFATLMVGVVVTPLLLIGPTLLGRMLPDRLQVLVALYWPVVTVLVVATLTTLYHIATPRRTPWVRNLPGAALTLILWAVTSYVVRGTIAASLGGSSIFGPLSTPIVLLIWPTSSRSRSSSGRPSTRRRSTCAPPSVRSSLSANGSAAR